MVAENAPDNPAPDAAEGENRFAAGAAAHRVISQFGGIRPMANKLGVAVSTVQGWRERGAIPAGRRDAILAAAKAHEVELDEAALDAAAGDSETEAETVPPAETAKPAATAIPKSGPGKRDAGDKPARKPPEARAGSGSVGAWLGGFVLGAVVLALGAGGAVLTRDIWLPAAESEPAAVMDAGELQVFERRIAALESALAANAEGSGDAAALEALGGGLAEVQNNLTAARGRLDLVETRAAEAEALRDKLAVLEEQVAALAASAGVGEEVAALKARIEALADLESRVAALAESATVARGAATDETAVVLAVFQLRDALRGSGPFAAELTTLQSLAAGQDDAALADLIAPLGAHAAAGIPNLIALKATFPAAAREIVAQGQGSADDDWVDGMLRRLSGLVTVRRVGPVEGSGAGAVVARAEVELIADNLAGALAELDGLSGPAAQAANRWRAQAEARLAAERALAGLGQSIARRLGAADG
jgi:hypothetical protein